ncbi:unnamed protein product [Parnassius mnemosyne]|uniref:Uncharacterized protein n=1 Tax=Parnassius mnemosyne TaxID=213953 RepID=A0AAV1KPN7_9NEOP
MEKVKLYEEYRLIEKKESEVNGAWKGAHLLLFFMAFVFGSFCTFCFHMLMYLFDEKCVLFPKLLSLTSLRHNLIYEFIPDEKMAEMLPVDFLSTQWVDKSACYLPTYVPLVSGIFGLVWTTMFLMCSASSRTLTGLQRPWRVLPPVFIFSLLMGGLCVYSSAVTHSGLQELCIKLGEITGSTTCTYTVNVATLAYERRIRGVYQATRLTVASAWLHTACWLLSAALALVRVLLAVDFHLVRVTVHLQGDIDKMLERYESHVRTVSPDVQIKDKYFHSATKVHFKKQYHNQMVSTFDSHMTAGRPEGDLLYISDKLPNESKTSLVPDEQYKLKRLAAYRIMPKDKQFIVKLLYEILDSIDSTQCPVLSLSSSTSGEGTADSAIIRQFGQERITSGPQPQTQMSAEGSHEYLSIDLHDDQGIFAETKNNLIESLNKILQEFLSRPTTSSSEHEKSYVSIMKIASDMKHFLERKFIFELKSHEIDGQVEVKEPNEEQPENTDQTLHSESSQANSQVDDKIETQSKRKEKQD